MLAEQRRALVDDGAIAKRCAFRRAGNDADVPRLHQGCVHGRRSSSNVHAFRGWQCTCQYAWAAASGSIAPSVPSFSMRSRCSRHIIGLSIAPSRSTVATWMPFGPSSRAMLCAMNRSPPLAAANAAKFGLPRRLPEAPVKRMVPRPRASMRRAARGALAPDALEILECDPGERADDSRRGYERHHLDRAERSFYPLVEGDDLGFTRQIGGKRLPPPPPPPPPHLCAR